MHVSHQTIYRWLWSNPSVDEELSDCLRLPAELLGSHDLLDIALFKISVTGPWPHVEFGKSKEMKIDESCIAIGYPYLSSPLDDRTATIRLGRILFAEATPLELINSYRVKQGDSGGVTVILAANPG